VYLIKTIIKETGEVIEIQHRYSEFEALQKLLSIEKPGSIIPQIPERSITQKYISGVELNTRKIGLEKFLQQIMCNI